MAKAFKLSSLNGIQIFFKILYKTTLIMLAVKGILNIFRHVRISNPSNHLHNVSVSVHISIPYVEIECKVLETAPIYQDLSHFLKISYGLLNSASDNMIKIWVINYVTSQIYHFFSPVIADLKLRGLVLVDLQTICKYNNMVGIFDPINYRISRLSM